MADITNLFKATVKTVKARQKAQGNPVPVDKSILGQTKKQGEFAATAKDVVNNISKLREFLLEHRKDYLNFSNILGRETNKMSDSERDKIDTDSEIFMKTCSEAIRSLKSGAHAHKVQPQAHEHHNAVFSLIEAYLKDVCKIYSEQRAVRVKTVVDRKRISRLELGTSKRSKESFESYVTRDELSSNKKPIGEMTDKPAKRIVPVFDDSDDEMSPQEILMMDQENQQLYGEMNSMVDEVKQIEGKVVEITKLQEIFSEKVLEQEVDIDSIAGKVVGATENIKEANEEIREAIKNNAGLRVWILFFLIVCSFSLLFLDWYNT